MAKEITGCPLCGCKSIGSFPEANYHLNLVNPISVAYCTRCNFTFLSPRPGSEMNNNISKVIFDKRLESYGGLINYGKISQHRKDQFTQQLKDIDIFLKEKLNQKFSI
jgi:hypothetical protein